MPQLLAEYAVLLAQVVDHTCLIAVDPAGEGREDQSELYEIKHLAR